MRRYDDSVEVRRGHLRGVEAPDQFRWRGRRWQVRAVVAHWVETGAWWDVESVRAVADLVEEREVWRVEAGRSVRSGPDGEPDPGGVFDLSFDWSDGRWSLVGCAD